MKVSILGAGAWGTALALVLLEKKNEVFLWERFPEYAKVLKEKKENVDFLPGVPLPSRLRITTSFEEALKGAELVVFTVPSLYLREVVKEASPYFRLFKKKFGVSGVKGIEEKSLLPPSRIIEKECPFFRERIVILSGPSHAEEVGRKMPTAIVASSWNFPLAEKVQKIFMTPYFRVYTHGDPIGVEVGGALKNILALAMGICDGLKLGDNTKGALLTRGLSEIRRLGVRMGANPHTFSGLSGMGDLISTCFSKHSRNRRVGERIGKGESLKDILSSMKQVAEGVITTRAAKRLAEKMGVEMPITFEVYSILFRGKSPRKAMEDLMKRPARPELDEEISLKGGKRCPK